MFQLALGTVREYPGNTVDPFLPEEVSRTTPERAALIIQAMADRPKFVILPAVLKSAEQGPKQVRLSAIDALRRVGDGSCLSTLLEIAVGSDTELSQAAKTTLADLPGQNVNGEIVVLLPTSKGKTQTLLLQLVGQGVFLDNRAEPRVHPLHYQAYQGGPEGRQCHPRSSGRRGCGHVRA